MMKTAQIVRDRELVRVGSKKTESLKNTAEAINLSRLQQWKKMTSSCLNLPHVDDYADKSPNSNETL